MLSDYEPNRIQENTLEVNVVYELLDLAQSIWWFMAPASIRMRWSPERYLPFTKRPRFVLQKPTIKEEAGLGYDMLLKPINSNTKALFLQFKCGEPGTGEKGKSKYFNDASSNPYFIFKVNNNSKLDQHKKLQEINRDPKVNASVLYALPMIGRDEVLTDYHGKFLLNTRFLSVNEIDLKAEVEHRKAYPTDKKGFDWSKEHRLLVANNTNQFEINYYYYYLGLQELKGELLKEMIIHQLQMVYAQTWKNMSWRSVEVALSKYFLHLAYYFGIQQDALVSESLARLYHYHPEGKNNRPIRAQKKYKQWQRDLKPRLETLNLQEKAEAQSIWENVFATFQGSTFQHFSNKSWINNYSFNQLQSVNQEKNIFIPAKNKTDALLNTSIYLF